MFKRFCFLFFSLKQGLRSINKKAKAVILIASNWIVLFLFALMPITDDKCLESCLCPFHYVQNSDGVKRTCELERTFCCLNKESENSVVNEKIAKLILKLYFINFEMQ